MKSSLLFKLYKLFYEIIPTFFICSYCGLKFHSSWVIKGVPCIITRKWYDRLFRGLKGGTLIIGENFRCNNKVNSNSIGLIQPCVFDIAIDGGKLTIGNNVGISGSTINATTSVTIEDNVIIGSGCIITDTDSHPLDYESRLADDKTKTKRKPVLIKEGAFIGARTIILKGVTIGRHAIIGAGSVVSRDIPDDCIACGNPAKIIRKNQEDDLI